MKSESTAKPGKLTVLVFKDGFASRTFQIPFSWFSSFGIIVAALAALTVGAALIAARAYRAANRANPERVESLETELSDLKASNKLLENRLTERAAETPAAIPLTAAALPAAPVPAPTVTVTVTPTSQTALNVAPAIPLLAAASGRPLLFTALPPATKPAPGNPSTIPIEIHAPKAAWTSSGLAVTFDLQYSRSDKGTQQGHIVVLARGPETMVAYPEGVLNLSARDTLVAPDRGEYFSVSRFRSVRADFTPLKRGSIKEAEVLIFDANDNLLIHSLIEPGKAEIPEVPAAKPAPAPVKSRPAPKAKATPEDDTTDDSEAPQSAAPPASAAASAPAEHEAVPAPATAPAENEAPKSGEMPPGSTSQ
jgi:hypothetical protein